MVTKTPCIPRDHIAFRVLCWGNISLKKCSVILRISFLHAARSLYIWYAVLAVLDFDLPCLGLNTNLDF